MAARSPATPARKAGAIQSGGSAILTITNSTLAGNKAYGDGGAIFSYGDGTLLMTGCTLAGNTAGCGGAIYDYGHNTLVNGCTFSNNSIYAIYIVNLYGTPIVIDSVFSDTAADSIFGGYSGRGDTFNPPSRR